MITDGNVLVILEESLQCLQTFGLWDVALVRFKFIILFALAVQLTAFVISVNCMPTKILTEFNLRKCAVDLVLNIWCASTCAKVLWRIHCCVAIWLLIWEIIDLDKRSHGLLLYRLFISRNEQMSLEATWVTCLNLNFKLGSFEVLRLRIRISLSGN